MTNAGGSAPRPIRRAALAYGRRMEDLRQVAAFVAAADELHLGRAAATLGITRATLSGRLRRLETSLGMVLVDRSHRCRIALTQQGVAVLPVARCTIEVGRELVAVAEAVRSGRRGVVRVALVGDREPRAERLIEALATVDRGWRVEVLRMDPWAASRALALGRVECAISSRYLSGTTSSGLPDPRPHRRERQIHLMIDGREASKMCLGAEVAAARVAARSRRRELLRLWNGVVRGDPDVCAFIDRTRAAGVDVGLGLDPARPPRGGGP